MSCRWGIALVAMCACSKSPPAAEPEPTPAATPEAPPAPVVAPPADAAPPQHPTIRVERGSPVDVDDASFALVKITTESTDDGDTAAIDLTVDGEDVGLLDPTRLVGWTDDFRVEVVDHGDDFAVLQVDRVTDEVVAGSATKVRVRRKQSVDIGGGVSLRFLGHGHKMVASGGPSSPLMVAVEYRRGKQVIGESDPHLYPPKQVSWTWRDYAFAMTKYEYDDFMVLDVSRRVLAPVAPQ